MAYASNEPVMVHVPQGDGWPDWSETHRVLEHRGFGQPMDEAFFLGQKPAKIGVLVPVCAL